MATPIAGLKTMPTGTTKNEAVFNEGVILLEALTYRGVTSRSLLDPSTISSPAPTNGTIYLVPDGSPNAVGDWASQGGKVAVYYDGWRYIPPAEGLTLWVTDEAQSVQYRSGAWIDRNELPPTLLTDLSDVSLAGSPSPQNGETLTYNASLGLWMAGAGSAGAFSGCLVENQVAQSIPDTTQTALVFGTSSEQYDTDGYHDEATNNTRLTIPTGGDGYYLVTCGVDTAGFQAQGFYDLFIAKNGGSFPGEVAINVLSSNVIAESTSRVMSCSKVLYLVATNYVEAKIVQITGGARNTDANPQTFLQISKLGT